MSHSNFPTGRCSFVDVRGVVEEFYDNLNGQYCVVEYCNTRQENVKLQNAKNSCYTKSHSITNIFNVNHRDDSCKLNNLTSNLLFFLFELSTVAELCLHIFKKDLRYTLMQKSKDLLDNIFSQSDSFSLYDTVLSIQLWNSLIKVLKTYDAFVEIGKKISKGQTKKGLTILARSNREITRDKTDSETTSVRLTSNLDPPAEIRILRNLPDGRPNRVVPPANVYSCLPVFQGMENPNQRLQTFSHWPTKTKQWPLQLSNAGFYFTGAGTVVKCATCGVKTEVGSWSLEKPEVVHYKLNNNCGFLQENFPNLQRKNNHESSNAVGVCNHKTENAVSTKNHLADQNTVTAKRNPVQPEPTEPCLDNKSATSTRTSDQQSMTALQHRVKQSLIGTRTNDEQSRSNLQTSDQQSRTVLPNHVKQPATVARNNDQHSLINSLNGVQQSATPTPNYEQQLTAVTRNLIQKPVTRTRIHDQRSMNDNILVGTISSAQDIKSLPGQNISLDRPLYQQKSLENHPFHQTKSGASNDYEINTSWTNSNSGNLILMENSTTLSYLDDSGRSIHENYHPNMNNDFASNYYTNTLPDIGSQVMTRPMMSSISNYRDRQSTGLYPSTVYMDFPSSSTVHNREYEPAFSHPINRHLEQRLLTFRNWTKNHIQPIETLAECGLFYTGEDDIVRCFCCNLGLSEWAEEDNPWTEHAKHQPKCWFLRKQKGQGFIDHVQETWKRQYCPKNAAFDDYNSRLATFGGWREDISQTPEILAEAGFFFTGEEDIVRCHYCDGGLRNWEPYDIPWEEHARWFSSCKFLVKMKGMRYIQRIQEKYQNGSNTTNTENQAALTTENTLSESEPVKGALRMGFSLNDVKAAVNKYVQTLGNREFTTNDLVNTIIETQPPSSHNKATSVHNRLVPVENDIKRLRVINSDLKANLLCVLCKQNERSMLFTNCGHRVTCESCCGSIDFCPTCDKRIKKRIKTFLS